MLHFLFLLVLVVVGLCLVLMWREPRLLYYPDRTPFPTPRGFTDLNLTTSDGVRIHGWYLPGPANAPVTVLILHGNAGNLSHREEKIAHFHDLGAHVCIIDYRGYGRSAGTPNEAGTYRDAQAAYEYLASQSSNIVVYGESLGSAVAVELATRVPVAGLILEEGFTSVGDIAQSLFPFLPVRYLVRNKYDSVRKLPGLHVPILIFHSRDDEVAPYRHGERLFAAANQPKTFIPLRGSHNEAFVTSATEYRQGLERFMNGLVAGRRSE